MLAVPLSFITLHLLSAPGRTFASHFCRGFQPCPQLSAEILHCYFFRSTQYLIAFILSLTALACQGFTKQKNAKMHCFGHLFML